MKYFLHLVAALFPLVAGADGGITTFPDGPNFIRSSTMTKLGRLPHISTAAPRFFTVNYDPPSLCGQCWRTDTLSVPGVNPRLAIELVEGPSALPAGCEVLAIIPAVDTVKVKWFNWRSEGSCDPRLDKWVFRQQPCPHDEHGTGKVELSPKR